MGEITVCSIGTTHPWNVAGVGLDQRIGSELGIRVVTVVAAVSAQDERGVHALEPVTLQTLEAQLAVIPWSAVGAVRVGALGSARAIEAVADALEKHAVPVVIDPVLAASSGGGLAGEGAVAAIRERFLPLSNAVVTPNLDEGEALLGRTIARDELEASAAELRDRGARAVLLKGGHLIGEPVDVLATREGTLRFEDSRIPGEMRGTGCTLAMALACALARGDELIEAVRFARGIVREKIAKANL